MADLADIITSKRSAGRARDVAIKNNKRREDQLRALNLESERALIDLIRRGLAMPAEKRLNFLRVRLPGGGSHL